MACLCQDDKHLPSRFGRFTKDKKIDPIGHLISLLAHQFQATCMTAINLVSSSKQGSLVALSCRVPLLVFAALLLLLLATVLCEADTDYMRQEYLRDWRTLPPNVPPNINNEDELDAMDRFVSPVLSSGFGNILFQMAAGYSVAKEFNNTCLIAWWDQDDPNLIKPLYLPYHGRPAPAPGITLCKMTTSACSSKTCTTCTHTLRRPQILASMTGSGSSVISSIPNVCRLIILSLS
jgi:hypothetical protein